MRAVAARGGRRRIFGWRALQRSITYSGAVNGRIKECRLSCRGKREALPASHNLIIFIPSTNHIIPTRTSFDPVAHLYSTIENSHTAGYTFIEREKKQNKAKQNICYSEPRINLQDARENLARALPKFSNPQYVE